MKETDNHFRFGTKVLVIGHDDEVSKDQGRLLVEFGKFVHEVTGQDVTIGSFLEPYMGGVRISYVEIGKIVFFSSGDTFDGTDVDTDQMLVCYLGERFCSFFDLANDDELGATKKILTKLLTTAS